MARNLFRGAPELSRLFVEAPVGLLTEFLSHKQFSVFLADTMSVVPADADEQTRRDAMAEVLKNLDTSEKPALVGGERAAVRFW